MPINTVVYAGIPPEKNNAVSGIVNLARNMGGDIGIAFVTTLVARRTQLHQARLAEHLDPGAARSSRGSPGCAGARAGGQLVADAVRQAYGAVYRQLLQQAQTLAYLDVLFLLACFTAAMVPLVFLTRRVQGGQLAAH